MGSAKFSQEHKQKFVNDVITLNKQGMSIVNAVKKLGHTTITFRNWKKALAKQKKTEVVFHPTTTAVRFPTRVTKTKKTTMTDGKVAVFYCTPTQAAEIIRGL